MSSSSRKCARRPSGRRAVLEHKYIRSCLSSPKHAPRKFLHARGIALQRLSVQHLPVMGDVRRDRRSPKHLATMPLDDSFCFRQTVWAWVNGRGALHQRTDQYFKKAHDHHERQDRRDYDHRSTISLPITPNEEGCCKDIDGINGQYLDCQPHSLSTSTWMFSVKSI